MKKMKNLKVLIITDDEKSSPLMAKIVAEIISSLKLGANFFYAESFEALTSCHEKLIKSGHYDMICLLVNEFSVKMYDVIDDIEGGPDKNFFFLVSPVQRLVDRATEIDKIELAFLLNEKYEIWESEKELIKEAFVSKMALVTVCS